MLAEGRWPVLSSNELYPCPCGVLVISPRALSGALAFPLAALLEEILRKIDSTPNAKDSTGAGVELVGTEHWPATFSEHAEAAPPPPNVLELQVQRHLDENGDFRWCAGSRPGFRGEEV